jgi:cytochrome c553
VLAILLAIPLAAAADTGGEFFEMRVRPVLAKNCFACHAASKMGGLEMRSRESLLKGGNSGPAIVPGDPDNSLLLRAVRHQHDRIKMPPQGTLKEDEIATLAEWVKSGAEWPATAAPIQSKTSTYIITPEQRAFWSFQPVRKPDPPAVKNTRWARTPIDRFILAGLEAKGLTPVAPADKRNLLRRASYDLIGLPPTPEEMNAFVNDKSPNAFATVVDRLLASPHYGERWGRHWLDVARYSDDKLAPQANMPYPNAFRFRDWVIQAFNDDMPYDLLVKAQIAGDLLPNPEKTAAGLGLYALSPEFQDDRVDVTTRGFLGLTAACAQCHDHKFDPIPTKDYYSLLGVFSNTKLGEYPLAPESTVAEYKARKKRVDDAEAAVRDFVTNQSDQLAQVLAARTSDYLIAACRVGASKAAEEDIAKAGSLDAETLKRWIAYLKKTEKEHPFLNAMPQTSCDEMRSFAADFQERALALFAEKKSIDEQNVIRLGGSMERKDLSSANLLSLERNKYFLWRDLFGTTGIYHYGESGIGRFLYGEWKTHLTALQAELKKRKSELPEQYPFLQIVQDVDKPANPHVFIRGDRNNPGEEVQRHFLSILSAGDPKPFTKGAGRLELAEAIANPANPLTARVMVNRIWQSHFGEGIVRTASNFGQLGERPSNPELLDYLAARFVENKWSMKAMHREIMLSSVYRLGVAESPKAVAADPGNRLLWRANRRRLDAESLRDSVLLVSGKLDLTVSGKPAPLNDENRRRTVYGFVSRKDLAPMLALFDFPNPNSTSEQRVTTNVPLQGLFLLNSSLMMLQSEELARRVASDDARAAIRKTYNLLFNREPSTEEIQLGVDFIGTTKEKAWPKYLQVLLSSPEFLFVS